MINFWVSINHTRGSWKRFFPFPTANISFPETITTYNTCSSRQYKCVVRIRINSAVFPAHHSIAVNTEAGTARQDLFKILKRFISSDHTSLILLSPRIPRDMSCSRHRSSSSSSSSSSSYSSSSCSSSSCRGSSCSSSSCSRKSFNRLHQRTQRLMGLEAVNNKICSRYSLVPATRARIGHTVYITSCPLYICEY